MGQLTSALINDAGIINPHDIADTFHTSVKEIAALTGLSTDTIAWPSRYQAKASQQRLRDVVMILNRALPWCGTPMQAYAWFRSEPLPSFGDLTAEDLVKRGMANAVLEHLGRVADGGYA